jgi:hypothetical protein
MSESFFKRLTLLQRETPAVTKPARKLMCLVWRAFATIRPFLAAAGKSPEPHYSKRHSMPAERGSRVLHGPPDSSRHRLHKEKAARCRHPAQRSKRCGGASHGNLTRAINADLKTQFRHFRPLIRAIVASRREPLTSRRGAPLAAPRQKRRQSPGRESAGLPAQLVPGASRHGHDSLKVFQSGAVNHLTAVLPLRNERTRLC